LSAKKKLVIKSITYKKLDSRVKGSIYSRAEYT
jgi:hypothetical protein